jgi:filamin
MDSEHVKGSPFACNVYDVSQVRVTGLKTSGVSHNLPVSNRNKIYKVFVCQLVGHPVTFSVDAAEAGEGTLELVVSTAQGTVKAEVAACARGLYQVTFIPPRADPHFVHISFNEDDVPGQC